MVVPDWGGTSHSEKMGKPPLDLHHLLSERHGSFVGNAVQVYRTKIWANPNTDQIYTQHEVKKWHYDLQDSMKSDAAWVWVLLKTNKLAMCKAWEPKAKLPRSSWNWNLVRPNLSYSGIPLCKICWTAFDSWSEQLHVMANLRMSRRSGQSELKSCIHLTDRIAHFVTWMVAKCWINWHLALAKCMVPSGLSHRLCCDNRAVKICVAGCFNCTEGVTGSFSCRSDTAFAYYIAVYHWQPVIQYNVGQT